MVLLHYWSNTGVLSLYRRDPHMLLVRDLGETDMIPAQYRHDENDMIPVQYRHDSDSSTIQLYSYTGIKVIHTGVIQG